MSLLSASEITLNDILKIKQIYDTYKHLYFEEDQLL